MWAELVQQPHSWTQAQCSTFHALKSVEFFSHHKHVTNNVFSCLPKSSPKFTAYNALFHHCGYDNDDDDDDDDANDVAMMMMMLLLKAVVGNVVGASPMDCCIPNVHRSQRKTETDKRDIQTPA